MMMFDVFQQKIKQGPNCQAESEKQHLQVVASHHVDNPYCK